MKRKQLLPTPEETAATLKGKELKTPDNRDVVERVLDGLTAKQRKYAILCVTHPYLSDVERFELSGYKPSGGGPECLKRIDGKIGELLLAIGVTGRDLAMGIRHCMTATKPLFHKVPIYGKKGRIVRYEEKKFDVPDNTIRFKTVELLAKTGNYFPAKVVKGDHTIKHSLDDRHLQALRDRENFLSKEIESNAEVVSGQPAAN
jgi:hypothetical protein